MAEKSDSPSAAHDFELERTVSGAVVKADHSPIIDTVLTAINTAAAAIAVINPQAGAALQTTAILGGWVWNQRKFDRVKPVLEEVQKRIQTVESEYVRREEFADLLEDSFRRLGDQPDGERRNRLTNILLNIVEKPKDHAENRLFLRLADELSAAAHKVLTAIPEPITNPGDTIPGRDEIVRRRTGLPVGDIKDAFQELVRSGLIDLDTRGAATLAKNGFYNLLTGRGRDFLAYRSG